MKISEQNVRPRNRKSMRSLLIAAMTTVALIGADAAGAVALVVRSSGPSSPNYRPGKALPENARVALRPGDVVVVLASDSTHTFHGPGTFALAGGSDALPSMMAGRRGRFSELRTAGIVPKSPTIWHVDVTQSGKVCLADPKNVMLWRPDARQAATLSVTGGGADGSTAQWPAGQSTLAWPDGVPIVAGTEYQLRMAPTAAPVKLTFETLPVMPTDLTSVAKALIDQHCETQLDLLIATVPTAPAG